MSYTEKTQRTERTGVAWAKYQCEKRGIVFEVIPYTYDVILPKNKYSIEIKTSKVQHDVGYDSRGKYCFRFKDKQLEKNAFDYAICVGLDDDYNAVVSYIVPQQYIYEQAKTTNNKNKDWSFKIPVCNYTTHSLKAKWTAFRTVDIYQKFEMCKNKYELLDIDNKSSFTYYKNKLYKQLNEYDNLQDELLSKRIVDMYNDGKTLKQISKALGCSVKTVRRWRKKINIRKSGYYNKRRHHNEDGTPKKIHKCKDCGYETRLLSRMKDHKNRKTSCKTRPNTWNVKKEGEKQ